MNSAQNFFCSANVTKCLGPTRPLIRACNYLSPVIYIDIENFDLFYQEFNEYVNRFKYAYTFLLDYAASKHVVPFTSFECKDTMTLTHLFLSRLSKSFIHSIYGRTNKRLSRFKSIESLIRSAEKTVRILHKQYCKSNEVNDMT